MSEPNRETYGLHNESAFVSASNHLLAMRDPEHPWAVLLSFYIEHFKFIKNALGSEAGESLVRRTAGALHEVFPSPAVLGRLRPDEFVVLVLMPDARSATRLLDRLLDVIEMSNVRSEGPGVSLSGGFSQFDTRAPVGIARLLHSAAENISRDRTSTCAKPYRSQLDPSPARWSLQ